MVAAGTCLQAYWLDSPLTVYLKFEIHPDHPQFCKSSRSCLRALQGLLVEHGCDFRRLVARAREDDCDRVRFLVENGFREEMRSPASSLLVADFEESVGERAYTRLAQSNVRLITLAELCNEEPDWKRKLRDLRWDIVRDVPSTEPFAKPTVAEFEEMVLEDPALDEEAFFIAQVEDGTLIGMSNLWRNDPEGKRLDTGTDRRSSFLPTQRDRYGPQSADYTVRPVQRRGDDRNEQRGGESDVCAQPQTGLQAKAGVG